MAAGPSGLGLVRVSGLGLIGLWVWGFGVRAYGV